MRGVMGVWGGGVKGVSEGGWEQRHLATSLQAAETSFRKSPSVSRFTRKCRPFAMSSVDAFRPLLVLGWGWGVWGVGWGVGVGVCGGGEGLGGKVFDSSGGRITHHAPFSGYFVFSRAGNLITKVGRRTGGSERKREYNASAFAYPKRLLFN